jgi:hypothetical protein
MIRGNAMRICEEEKSVKDQPLAGMEACNIHQLEMRIIYILVHKDISHCLKGSFRRVIPEVGLNRNSIIGEVSFIEMDNEVIRRIVNRELQVIRAVMRRAFLLKDDTSRLVLILSNYDSCP